MRTHLTLSLLAALLSMGAAAAAADLPTPKVFSDAPPDKGSWRMEMLDMPGASSKGMAVMAGGMTVCSTAAQAMSDKTPASGNDKTSCATRVLEDRADRAMMEITCTGERPSTVKSTITRVAPRTYEVASEMSSAGMPKPTSMRMRMSYAGTCSASDAAVKLDKSSPICAQAKPQLAQMDPAKCPKGANNAQCVQQMTTARAQLEAMCK